jgi:hypothetical protein
MYVSHKSVVTPKQGVGTWRNISQWLETWGPIGTNAKILVDAELQLNNDGYSVTRTLVYANEDDMNRHLANRPEDMYTKVFDESDIEVKTF